MNHERLLRRYAWISLAVGVAGIAQSVIAIIFHWVAFGVSLSIAVLVFAMLRTTGIQAVRATLGIALCVWVLLLVEIAYLVVLTPIDLQAVRVRLAPGRQLLSLPTTILALAYTAWLYAALSRTEIALARRESGLSSSSPWWVVIPALLVITGIWYLQYRGQTGIYAHRAVQRAELLYGPQYRYFARTACFKSQSRRTARGTVSRTYAGVDVTVYNQYVIFDRTMDFNE